MGEETREKQTAARQEVSKPISLAELFKRDCSQAGYNVFQWADCQLRKDTSGDFQPFRTPEYGGNATGRSWNLVKNTVYRLIGQAKIKELESRTGITRGLEKPRDLSETQTEAGEYYRVGNSLVLLVDKNGGGTFLIIYGDISSEVAAVSWRGGRSLPDSSLVFELYGEEAIYGFLKGIDVNSKGYGENTRENYRVIHQTIEKIFPKEALGKIDQRMFHRQEIMEVLDLRGKGQFLSSNDLFSD